MITGKPDCLQIHSNIFNIKSFVTGWGCIKNCVHASMQQHSSDLGVFDNFSNDNFLETMNFSVIFFMEFKLAIQQSLSFQSAGNKIRNMKHLHPNLFWGIFLQNMHLD